MIYIYDIHYDHIVAVICNYAEHVLTFSRTPAGNSAYSQLYHIQRDALHTYRVRMICIYIYIIIYCTTVRTYIIYHTSLYVYHVSYHNNDSPNLCNVHVVWYFYDQQCSVKSCLVNNVDTKFVRVCNVNDHHSRGTWLREIAKCSSYNVR